VKGRAPPMRSHHPLLGAALLVGAVSTAVFAQPRPSARPGVRPAPARPGVRPAARVDGGAADAAAADAGPAAVVDGGAAPAAATDGGSADASAAVVDLDAGSVTVGDASFPMRQVGTGTLIHFPVPEQLQRTGVPVFAQVRSSAPIDHVSLYVRALGARRYTEIRMQAMGQQFRLASGYGAMIPCEDVFPPKVTYYVEAYSSSGDANGHAGTAEAPLEVPVVELRHYPAPTLPGQAPPRTCGSMTTGPTARDAGSGPAAPERGSADLGEPCRATNDCRPGLRCGSNNQCVFDR
jgi:hypothetical protein